MKLGTARRSLGQKSSAWTPEKNAKLVAKIDKDGDGEIDKNEFVTHFDGMLPRDQLDFDNTVDQFMDVARACRQEKIKKKEAAKPAAVEQKWRDRTPVAPRKAETSVASREYLNLPMGIHEGKYKRIQTPIDLRLAMLAEIDANMPVESPELTNLRYRERRLQEVFRQFDIDGGGTIGKEELLELGKARRRLGQKQGAWTDAANRRMMRKMGATDDDEVSEANFVTFFNGTLSQDRSEFDLVMDQFMAVASAVRHAKASGMSWGSPTQAGGDSLTSTPATSPQSSPRSPGNRSMGVAPSRGDGYTQHRKDGLARVFREFDIDGSGEVSSEELFKLGTARRSTGQKSGTWSESANARLVRKMDKDGDGAISQDEFVTHFEEILPRERFQFDEVIEQFMVVAKAAKREKRMGGRDLDVKKTPSYDTPPKREMASRTPGSRGYDSPWPKGGLADPMMEVRRRQTCLQIVFKMLDKEEQGKVPASALMALGKAIPQSPRGSPSKRDWSNEKNTALVKTLGSGLISQTKFVTNFNEALSDSSNKFDATIEMFMSICE